jgi:hypothetical protein
MTKQETLVWKGEKQLTWKNFKAKSVKSSPYEALSAVGISAGYSMLGNEIDFEVTSFFIPKNSWTKDKQSQYLLNHEQKHFDISEIHARKFRKAISEKDWSKKTKSIAKQFNALLKEFTNAEKRMQEDYDKQSKHSILKSEQFNWDKKISDELKRLKEHAEHKVHVQLN